MMITPGALAGLGLDLDDARLQKFCDGIPAWQSASGYYFEYSSTTRFSLMSGRISSRSGSALSVPVIFFSSTSTQSGKPTCAGDGQRVLRCAACLRDLLAHRDHVAGLAPGTTGCSPVSPLTWIALWLTSWRASARVDGEAHAVDDVVQPRLRAAAAGSRRSSPCGRAALLVVVAELALEHAVHAAQLLLLAQLQAVVGQPRAARAA